MLTELRAIQTGVVQFLSARALYLVFFTLNSVQRDMYRVTGNLYPLFCACEAFIIHPPRRLP